MGQGCRCRLHAGWRVLRCGSVGGCGRLLCWLCWACPSLVHDPVASLAEARRHGAVLWSHWAVVCAEESAFLCLAECGRGACGRCLQLCRRCGLEWVAGGWHSVLCRCWGVLGQDHLCRWSSGARLGRIGCRPWRPRGWHSFGLGTDECFLADGLDGRVVKCGGWGRSTPSCCGVGRWCSGCGLRW